MNSYDLSRSFINFAFENPDKIKPNHYAIYFFAIEHCNRLGWKSKFGLPTTMAMEAIGIKSYNTYINALNELVEWGFIQMIEKSKNQYSSNIIALSNFDKAHNKALDKALIKHTTKHCRSTRQSIDSINKQETNKQETNKQETNKQYANKLAEGVIEYYNGVCVNLPKVVKLTDKRKKHILAREQEYSKEDIKKVIDLTAESNFLNGQNANGWTASFDWIIDKSNFIKILENNYINKKNGKDKRQISVDDFNESIERHFR